MGPRKSDAFLSRPRTHDKALQRKAVVNLAGGRRGNRRPGSLSAGEFALVALESYLNVLPGGGKRPERAA